MLYAGETPLGTLVNGENRFDVPKSAVSDGSLLLRVLLSAGSDALFDETKPYGSYNLDDIVIESAAFAYADGTEAAPVRTLLYLPVKGQAGVTERESEGRPPASPSATAGTPRRGWAAARRRRRSASAFCSRPTSAGARRSVRRTPRAFPTARPTQSLYDSATGEPAGETLELYVCNTAPDVIFPLESGGRLPAGEALTLTVGDNAWGLKTAAVYVNDTLLQSVQAAGEVTLKAAALRTGANRVRVSTEDTAGNTAEHFLLFTVSETPDYVFRAEGAGAAFELDGVEGTLYGAVKAKKHQYVPESAGRVRLRRAAAFDGDARPVCRPRLDCHRGGREQPALPELRRLRAGQRRNGGGVLSGRDGQRRRHSAEGLQPPRKPLGHAVRPPAASRSHSSPTS